MIDVLPNACPQMSVCIHENLLDVTVEAGKVYHGSALNTHLERNESNLMASDGSSLLVFRRNKLLNG